MAILLLTFHGELFKVQVDNDDFNRVAKYKWNINFNHRTYKPRANVDGKLVYLSRYILNVSDRKLTVDHINYDVLDNRKSNLRVITNKENCRLSRPRRNSSSKYKGVCIKGKEKKFRVKIKVDGKDIELGRYYSEIEAAKKYNEAALKYYGKYAYLNPIDSKEKPNANAT